MSRLKLLALIGRVGLSSSWHVRSCDDSKEVGVMDAFDRGGSKGTRAINVLSGTAGAIKFFVMGGSLGEFIVELFATGESGLLEIVPMQVNVLFITFAISALG